jgi:hypothetical protein
LVQCGDDLSVLLGEGGNYQPPQAASFSLPSLSGGSNNTYGSEGGIFNQGIFDGTNVWTTFNDSDGVGIGWMYVIDPTTLDLIATYELDGDSVSNNQMGFDGRYIYVAYGRGGLGICVFDTVDLTFSTIGSGTQYYNCYYSSHLSKVVVSDTDTNVFTMPVGGGALTNIGNLQSITGDSELDISGFCDGEATDTLWASCSGAFTWNIKYGPGYANNGQVLL